MLRFAILARVSCVAGVIEGLIVREIKPVEASKEASALHVWMICWVAQFHKRGNDYKVVVSANLKFNELDCMGIPGTITSPLGDVGWSKVYWGY
jgi:hypothetical protein